MTALVPSQKRTLAAVALCCLLVALAGCSGMSSPNDSGPTDNESTNDGAASERLIEVAQTHAEYLRSTRNVTVTQTLQVTNSVTDFEQRTEWRIDFESGRVFNSNEPLSGTASEEFRTADGTVYKRFGSGPRPFVRPDQTEPLNPEQAVQLSTPLDSMADRYERRGTRTTDGVEATVYEADSLGDASNGYGANISTANIERYQSIVVVAPSGYVLNTTVAITVSRDGRTRRIRETLRFRDLGQTTVEEPAWLADAKAFARQPRPGDVVSRTYNATGAGGLVQLNVSAEKGELDAPSTVGPEISENPIFRNELLNSVRAGSIARYYFVLDTIERAEVRIHYDQREIAPENESELRVAVYRGGEKFWDVLNTTVDEEENVVTATITDPENLETYQGETMIAMRFEEFVQRPQEQNRR